LLTGCSWKHHIGYYQINTGLTLFVNFHGIWRIGGGQNFKTSALQNVARGLPHKRLVLDQKNGAAPGLIVCVYVGLKSHRILQFCFSDSSSAIACPIGLRKIFARRTKVCGVRTNIGESVGTDSDSGTVS
jgi:hypothetical protein